MTGVLLTLGLMAFSIAGLLASQCLRNLSRLRQTLLVVGSTADGLIGWLILTALGVSSLHALGGGALFGIVSFTYLQPMLVPQRWLMWRLAKENIRRRPRQAVLLVAGLVISSAIITSSLVVGDSLDATVLREVEASWDETDVLVAGFDQSTGLRVEFDQDLAERTWERIQTDPTLSSEVVGRQYGAVNVVSLSTNNSQAEPAVSWFARDAAVDAEGIWSPLGINNYRYIDVQAANDGALLPQIAVNKVASEALGVVSGDLLTMGYHTTSDGDRIRQESTVQVATVVAQTGQGASAGTQSPAVFTDLATAQQLTGSEGRLNRMSLSLHEDISSEAYDKVIERLTQTMAEEVTASDAGLNLTYDDTTASITLSSTQGLGRLSAQDVVALRENKTGLLPNTTLLEVLQVPLIDAAVEGAPLLSLADGDVTELHGTQTAVWHRGPGGFGVEHVANASTWVWQVESGDRLHDVVYHHDGQQALGAHDNGLVLASTAQIDDEDAGSVSDEGPYVAAEWFDDGWVTVLADDDRFELQGFNQGLERTFSHEVDVSRPSTVLQYELQIHDERLLLGIEGLLEMRWYEVHITPVNLSFDETDAPPEENGSVTPPEVCNGRAIATGPRGNIWCSVEGGLALVSSVDESVVGLRLPFLSDAPGFGTFPQMLLAFGGEGMAANVDEGNVSISPRLSALALNTTSNMSFTGLVPFAFGNDTATSLVPSSDYTSLPGLDSLSELEALVLGVISLEDAEVLALAEDDERSILLIQSNNSGFVLGEDALERLTAWFNERSTPTDMGLEMSAVKRDAAEQAEASSGVLSAMFLVFGSFTIAAGVLLSLTIIMLLADVRRKETAVVRAVGLQQSDARAMFVQEGLLLAMIAGAIGAVIGLALAWIIAVGFTSIFSSVGAQKFAFSFTMDSLIAGWVWGTLLAYVLLASSAIYNAQLNIVQAIRGARPRWNTSVPWGLLLMQVLALGGSILFLGVLLLSGRSTGFAYALYVLSGSLLLLAVTPVVTWQTPLWLNRKSAISQRWVRHAPRNTLGAVGVGFLLWTMALAPFDPVRSSMEPNELAFIVLGLTQVAAGVMVLTSLAPLFVQRLSKSRWVTKRTGPIGAVALAHPLAAPWRSAVVMGMFSITMFSVVVLSGYTAQFDTYSTGFVEEAEGEFELMIASSRSRPIDIDNDPDSWGLDADLAEQIDAAGRVARATAFLEDDEGQRIPYILRGVDRGFIEHGGLPLYAWDGALGSTSDDAWDSIGRFNNIVFLDASFGLESAADGSGLSPMQLSIGDEITIVDFSNPKNTLRVTVGGFLEQSSYLFSPGVWMASDPVTEQFSGEVTRMYVSLADDAEPFDAEYSSLDVSGQGKSVDVRRAALELEDALQQALVDDGVVVDTVVEDIMIIQGLVLAILALFEGYLAVGLIVGVAGIGVVTVRNVSERKRSVGMLRALGFQRRHVLGVFVIEVTWLAVVGLLNGLVMGYGFHRMLYESIWAEQGAAFLFPWGRVLALLFGCWFVVLLATMAPVRRAANIPPSAALRSV